MLGKKEREERIPYSYLDPPMRSTSKGNPPFGKRIPTTAHWKTSRSIRASFALAVLVLGLPFVSAKPSPPGAAPSAPPGATPSVIPTAVPSVSPTESLGTPTESPGTVRCVHSMFGVLLNGA